MEKAFRKFADSALGSWIIMGLAVVAFILFIKLLAAQFLGDSGVPGAFKAAIGAI